MDLARAGISRQNRVEDALQVHIAYLAGFILEEDFQPRETRTLSDFSPFEFTDRESLSACLSQNAVHLLGLAIWVVLGFAGAYTAILRYDAR